MSAELAIYPGIEVELVLDPERHAILVVLVLKGELKLHQQKSLERRPVLVVAKDAVQFMHLSYRVFENELVLH